MLNVSLEHSFNLETKCHLKMKFCTHTYFDETLCLEINWNRERAPLTRYHVFHKQQSMFNPCYLFGPSCYGIWTILSALLTEMKSGLQRTFCSNQVSHFWISYEETTCNIFHELIKTYGHLLLISWKKIAKCFNLKSPALSFSWKHNMVQARKSISQFSQKILWF